MLGKNAAAHLTAELGDAPIRLTTLIHIHYTLFPHALQP